jgi:HD-GYP domain-containing protein (c-di-GMP phosphodiesterase class II)
LLALADVYEALTSPRPYRAALTSRAALAVIRAEVPRRLDPEAFRTLETALSDDTQAWARKDVSTADVAALLSSEPRP